MSAMTRHYADANGPILNTVDGSIPPEWCKRRRRNRYPVRRLLAMPAPDWIEHRRSDGEHVGWVVPAGDGFHIVDLLGRRRSQAPVDWPDAEEALETLGIGYLANRYSLRLADGVEQRVRIGEVSASGIVVVADDFGSASAVGANPTSFELPFPAPEGLRSLD
jgi:hypothetical protein